MRGSWVLAMAVGLALAAGGVAWVARSSWADFAAGFMAFQRGDYTASRAKWLPLAEQGDAMAQYNLGVMYNSGQGVPQDHAEAARWFRLAADQGMAGAQFNLGVMYGSGQGVPQDDATSAHWYLLAADQGIAEAQFNLALNYANGQGASQDFAEAARWYRLAANQGGARAQNNLGVMYEIGQGVAQDYAEAAQLYRLSASQGHARAQNNLARLYRQGRGTARYRHRPHVGQHRSRQRRRSRPRVPRLYRRHPLPRRPFRGAAAGAGMPRLQLHPVRLTPLPTPFPRPTPSPNLPACSRYPPLSPTGLPPAAGSFTRTSGRCWRPPMRLPRC